MQLVKLSLIFLYTLDCPVKLFEANKIFYKETNSDTSADYS